MSDDKCIQINTLIDKKTSFILFKSSIRAKHVYTLMNSNKKTAIMKELTIFSENVELLQLLLRKNKTTESFDIITKNYQNTHGHASQKKINHQKDSLDNFSGSNSFSTKTKSHIEDNNNKDRNIPKEYTDPVSSDGYNPLQRDLEVSKYIVPSISKLGDSDKNTKGKKRFIDDNKTVSAGLNTFNDPNK